MWHLGRPLEKASLVKKTGLCALLRFPRRGGTAALLARSRERSGAAPRVAHSSEKASQRSTSGWLEGIAGGAKEREGVYVTSNTPLSTVYEERKLVRGLEACI